MKYVKVMFGNKGANFEYKIGEKFLGNSRIFCKLWYNMYKTIILIIRWDNYAKTWKIGVHIV